MSGAFDLLARPIQRSLWDMKWEALRPIQEAAIREITSTQRDVVISAKTAAGKTEAAFLPILSHLTTRPESSIQALYVGPLKALINDQFGRLDRLCERAEIAVHRWHGDVDAGKKQRTLQKPEGVLLITPESLEAIFVRRSTEVNRLFRHLSFVVIDEIHSFVGRERGTQLRNLLYRLEQRIGRDFRMVGLSATLGNAFPIYQGFLRPNEPERVTQLVDNADTKGLLYRIHAYLIGKEGADHDTAPPPPPVAMIDDMMESFAGRTNLLFTNSRSDIEGLADSLNRRCQEMGRPQEFLVHHGSLSKEVREYAEEAMRGQRPFTTICSATLELGIDVGNVTCVGQLGAPWSASSLIQRVGRSGRREGESQRMRVFLKEYEATATSSLVDRLYPGVLQAIALTELMLQAWVEPPSNVELDLSTTTQQLLSILAETGGIRIPQLFERLVTKGQFRSLASATFVDLLRCLKNTELVEQLPEGEVVLAPKGERIVNHYDFYSAFATPQEYSVIWQSRTLGRLPIDGVPNPGEFLLFAGRRWRVVGVDHEATQIAVTPAKAGKVPRFSGEGGAIHAEVRRKMRHVLFCDEVYPYLNDQAANFLAQARTAARDSCIDRQSLVPTGPTQCLWFTWAGTRVDTTLQLMAKTIGLESSTGFGAESIALQFSVGIERVVDAFKRIAATPPTALSLAATVPNKRTRKFDWCLSDELLTQAIASGTLDQPGALLAAKELFAAS